MRKIVITTRGNAVSFNSFQDMLDRSIGYIGFTPGNYESRYMIVKGGSARGLAVCPEGTWSSKETQSKITEGYYIFDSKEELLQWMIEGDCNERD